jgi:uncharacterized membrane protein YkvA (DUF1232 family)
VALVPWGALLALAALYLAVVVSLLVAGRRAGARAVAGFLPDCAVMLRRLAASRRSGRAERVVLVALAAYLLSPLDLVPDFVPVAGQLDDAIILLVALRRLLRRHGAEEIRAAWPGPESSLSVVLRAAGAGRAARLPLSR